MRGIFHHKLPLGGDGILTGYYIKLVLKNPLSNLIAQNIHTAQVGWPGKLNFSSFPVGQTTELIAIRTFSKISGITDPSTLIHIVSILKVVPISLAAYIFARSLRLPRYISFIIGLAYSVSTFNLVRSEGHFFLALTWPIALGMAAIFMAFERSNSQKPGFATKQRPYLFLKLTILLTFVAFSSFYYVLILGLIAASILGAVLFSEIWLFCSTKQWPALRMKLNELIRRMWALIYISFFLLIGLLAQTLPIVLRSDHGYALTGIADRSPIESIVYAGSLESFFYDSSTFVLRILGRPDLSNFLGSRISWEGSQLGALTGFVAYAVIIILVLQLFKNLVGNGEVFSWLSEINADLRFRFIFLTSIFSIALYFPNPFNFAISRLIPQIRAWGRVSTVLTLLALCLLSLVISELRNHRIIAAALAIILTLVPLAEAGVYRQGRPPSIAVSNSAQQLINIRGKTLSSLRTIYPRGCAIFLAPVYPFPEFDIPNDSNGDYSALALPAQDAGYFKWSYPAAKDTAAWSAFQPLASEEPNFARASLNYQINYARALGACGAVIDRTLLTPPELVELAKETEQARENCFEDLPGETFNSDQRFASLRFSGNGCTVPVSPEVKTFADQNRAARILWKIDQPYGLGFLDKWQVFSNTSPIDFRLIKSNALGNKAPIYSFKFTPANPATPPSTLKVCLRRTTDIVPVCANVELNKNGEGSLVGEPSQLKTNLQKYEFTVAPESAALISNWGVVVGI